MIWQRKTELPGTETGPIASFFTTNPAYTGLDLNPGLRGEMFLSNRLIPVGSKSDLHSDRREPASSVRLHHILYIEPAQTT